MIGRAAIVLMCGFLTGATGELLGQNQAAQDSDAARDTTSWGDRLDAHRGFWISFGLGGGWDLDREKAGGATYLRMGGTIEQRLLVGGEVGGVFREESGGDVTVGNLTLSVLYTRGVGSS